MSQFPAISLPPFLSLSLILLSRLLLSYPIRRRRRRRSPACLSVCPRCRPTSRRIVQHGRLRPAIEYPTDRSFDRAPSVRPSARDRRTRADWRIIAFSDLNTSQRLYNRDRQTAAVGRTGGAGGGGGTGRGRTNGLGFVGLLKLCRWLLMLLERTLDAADRPTDRRSFVSLSLYT